MKKLIVLLATATLAFSTVAFAEDSPATTETAKAAATTQEATKAKPKHHHHKKHHCKKDCHCGD